MSFVAGLMAGLLVVLAVVWLRDRRSEREGRGGHLTDHDIRAIEKEGRVEIEDPLDIDHIRDEEARFWEESSWDEPDEW